jgi:hypothetical protein
MFSPRRNGDVVVNVARHEGVLRTRNMIWTVLGLSVAIIAVFCISVAEIVLGQPLFESHRPHIAGGLAAAGVMLAMFGVVFRTRRRASGDDDRRSFILFDLRFWGLMLIVFGVITVFIRPLKQMKMEVAFTSRQPAASQPVQAEKPGKPPVIFPKVRVQGVFLRNLRAAAILNGESYFVGDRIGNALVRTIDRNGVVLEMAGETKFLALN